MFPVRPSSNQHGLPGGYRGIFGRTSEFGAELLLPVYRVGCVLRFRMQHSTVDKQRGSWKLIYNETVTKLIQLGITCPGEDNPVRPRRYGGCNNAVTPRDEDIAAES